MCGQGSQWGPQEGRRGSPAPDRTPDMTIMMTTMMMMVMVMMMMMTIMTIMMMTTLMMTIEYLPLHVGPTLPHQPVHLNIKNTFKSYNEGVISDPKIFVTGF